MPTICYSEKYNDDVFEYRCVACGEEEKVSPRRSLLLCAYPASLLPLTRRAARHVVLPPDIAKLLPKSRLLSEVSSISQTSSLFFCSGCTSEAKSLCCSSPDSFLWPKKRPPLSEDSSRSRGPLHKRAVRLAGLCAAVVNQERPQNCHLLQLSSLYATAGLPVGAGPRADRPRRRAEGTG